jgi:hypothetical protein
MEVHHHSSPASDGTRGKKWTHYFWEFFMLFLAVFCGFLAENQREHYIERQRERQFIRSMVEDIKSDTGLLSSGITGSRQIMEANFQLLQELSKPEIVKNSLRALSLWKHSDYYPNFLQNDRTVQQLKSSGNLRLIRNKNVSDSIMEYDRQLRWLFEAQEKVNQFILQNQHYAFRLFSAASFGKKIQADSLQYALFMYDSILFSKPIPLLNTNPAFIDEVYGFRLEFADYMTDLLWNQQYVSNRGKRLIDFIKKEYRLK